MQQNVGLNETPNFHTASKVLKALFPLQDGNCSSWKTIMTIYVGLQENSFHAVTLFVYLYFPRMNDTPF